MTYAVTVMEERLLAKIKKIGAEIKAQEMNPSRRFSMPADKPEGTETVITRDQVVMFEAQLHIRHGPALVPRGLCKLIALQLAGEPLLGRSLFKAFGTDCQKVLSATADRRGGTIDVLTLVANKVGYSLRLVGRILDGVFRADRRRKDADLDDEEDRRPDHGPED